MRLQVKPARFQLSLLLALAALAPVSSLIAQQPDPHTLAPDASATVPDPAPDDSSESMLPHDRGTRFWLSGQANFIFQAHPPFHASYSGKNSLDPNYEKATSRVLTLYTGLRLNDSTEFLLDIEEAGGAALSTGLGLAGNTDLDIVRNPSLSKAPYLARGIIHKVFALSDDKVENDRNFLSLFKE